MTSLQFHSRAYHKAVLHAVKYPQYAINGLFTGYEQDGVIHITDAFPLFHSQITLTPLWEAALMQINSLLKLRNEENGQNKERVIGYYFANEHLDNKEMDQFIVQKILPQIGASQAIVFMIENEKLEQLDSLFTMRRFLAEDNKGSVWKMENDESRISWMPENEESTFKKLRNQIDNGVFHQLVDFEQHVDHLAFDYTNPNIL